MPCEDVSFPGGVRAKVCYRSSRPSMNDLQEVERFADYLRGDVLAYTDPAEEAAILEDIRRLQGAGSG